MTIRDKQSAAFSELSNDFRDHRFWQWHSIWYQAKVPIALPDVHSVLEFGPGRAVTKALVEHFGLEHTSVDLARAVYEPDHVSTLLDFESDRTFDLVCAFEVLEHNPRTELQDHLRKMAGLCNRYVYISLPYSGRWVSMSLGASLPRLSFRKLWSRATPRRFKQVRRDISAYAQDPDPHRFHWWEVGDKDSDKGDIEDEASRCGLRLNDQWHNPLFPFHWFALFEKSGQAFEKK